VAEGGDLQFERAEGPGAALSCASCQRTIPELYYEAAGRVFCAPCKDAFQAALAGGSPAGRFLAALAFGAVAAALSAVAWYAITKLTGYELGIVAIAVGLAVGAAVRAGSGGRGGRPYQLLAVALTYLAIAASYVPMVVAGFREQVPETEEAVLWVSAVLFSLALPVWQVSEGGFIGVLIVGFALFEAWRRNRRSTLAFAGPFRVGSGAGGAPA
jgi:hypothetical protein